MDFQTAKETIERGKRIAPQLTQALESEYYSGDLGMGEFLGKYERDITLSQYRLLALPEAIVTLR